ncbi:Antitoxin MazE5 [Mycobacterium simulans]|nr:Antitoxin MazE5 [Mycobacterium simulans]
MAEQRYQDVMAVGLREDANQARGGGDLGACDVGIECGDRLTTHVGSLRNVGLGIGHVAEGSEIGCCDQGFDEWVDAGLSRDAPRSLHGSLPRPWHSSGMNRIRLSTTVDAALLNSARDMRAGITDAALIDEALAALLARHRSAEVDASYAAYDKHPVDEPDEWGDLASWRRAAGDS